MTNTTNKIRALFLSALMVFSVFAGAVAFSGSVAAAANDTSEPYVDYDETLTDGGTYWQGQTLFIDSDDVNDSEWAIETVNDDDNPSGLEEEFFLDENGSATIDTSDLDGEYVIVDSSGDVVSFDSNGDATQTNGQDASSAAFDVNEQDLDVSWSDAAVDNAGAVETEFVLDSNRGQYSVDVSSDDLSAEELADIFNDSGYESMEVDTDADDENESVRLVSVTDGEYTANFTDVEGGDYDFDFEASDTTASSSDNITVNDVGDGNTAFADDASLEVAEGGVAEIPIELSGAATSGTLVIGEEDSDGYQANISFTDGDDDGEVTILFNTYAAGNGSNVVDVAGDEDSVDFTADDETDINSMLAEGDYTIATSSSSDPTATLDDPQDISSLYIGQRSTDEMSTWTAPSGVDFDADDSGEVNETDVSTLIEDGELTEDDTITTGEYVIHQVSATGLDGLVDNASGLENALNNGVNLTIEQANPIQNQDPKEVDLSETDFTYIEGDGVYYIAYDLDNVDFEDGESSVEDGDEYQAEFTVDDDRLLRSDDSDDHESVNATYEVEEESTSFDNDPVQVTASTNQSISGTTNLAPGTELTVRASSGDGVEPRFRNSETVTVQSDGTFEAEFDFDDNAVGDTFTAEVRQGGDSLVDADGEIVESVGTSTPGTDDGTPTTDDGTPTDTATPDDGTPTDTATPDDGGDDSTPTETTTPGFTAVLALIALIGAALVAVRRD